jgi:hypothetical protein
MQILVAQMVRRLSDLAALGQPVVAVEPEPWVVMRLQQQLPETVAPELLIQLLERRLLMRVVGVVVFI